MPKAKSYMNPNIPKPKPGDSRSEGRITKPMEPIKRREITPPKKEKRPLPRPLPGVKKPFDSRKERLLPRRVTPGSIKKSGDMGSRSRNQRSPKGRGGK